MTVTPATPVESFDVAVIGAGLAGLTCSQLLAEAGFRVLLVDRKTELSEGIHTTGIFVRRTLQDFDFPAGTLGPPVRHISLYSPARRVLELQSPHEEFRVGRMAALYAHLLQRVVAAGVTWRPATRYAGAAPDGTGMLVTLEAEGRSQIVRCRYLIGCDGANSRVARDLGLEENRNWIVGVEEVLAGASQSGEPRFHCFLDPKLAPGYIAWLVDDGEEIHLGVGGDPRKFEPLAALEAFKASLHPRFDLSGARLLEKRGGRIPVGGVLRRIVNARGLLIGDAAGAVSPLTAGGLDPCLRMSRLAARVAGEFLRGSDPAVLASYDGRRFRARFISRLFMRRMIGAFSGPWLLEIACMMLRTPVLKPLAWHVFFGRGSFPDLDLLPAANVRAKE